jgi:hypothetical protein
MKTNTDNTVGENTRIALAYIHIFADGSKYFGNATNPDRPFDFKKRTKTWLAAYMKNGVPVVQVRRNLTIEEADSLERWGFDRYVIQGGVKLQKRPNGVDLAILCRPKSDAHRTKLSTANEGKTTKCHRKVISMFDGRITSAFGAGKLNKSNPDYIGTWVDL